MPNQASMYGIGATRLKMDNLVISCSVSETHEYTADVTDHPIDAPVGGQAVDVADHRHISPFTLQIHGVISDAPTSLVDEVVLEAQGATQIGQSAVQVGYKALLALFASKDTFEVVTSLDRYKRMCIMKLTINREKTSGKIIDFNASLKQIRIATASTVNVIDAPKAAPQVKKDAKPTTHIDLPSAQNPNTVLHQLLFE